MFVGHCRRFRLPTDSRLSNRWSSLKLRSRSRRFRGLSRRCRRFLLLHLLRLRRLLQLRPRRLHHPLQLHRRPPVPKLRPTLPYLDKRPKGRRASCREIAADDFVPLVNTPALRTLRARLANACEFRSVPIVRYGGAGGAYCVSSGGRMHPPKLSRIGLVCQRCERDMGSAASCRYLWWPAPPLLTCPGPVWALGTDFRRVVEPRSARPGAETAEATAAP